MRRPLHSDSRCEHVAVHTSAKQTSCSRRKEGRAQMSVYRFCMLDPAGQIRDYCVLSCSTLEDAYDKGQQLLAEWPKVEIWESARRVGCLMPTAEHDDLKHAA